MQHLVKVTSFASSLLLTVAMFACGGKGAMPAPNAVTPSPLFSPEPPLSTGASPTPPAAGPFGKQRVTFQDPQGLTLVGFVYKPDGAGPFPAVVWNHGSEQNPGVGPEFDAIATVFVPAGYVLIAPVREGHGLSQGEYIGDVTQKTRQQSGAMAANQQLVQLMQGPQLDDQLAGLAYFKNLTYVDKGRIAVTGCSYGGIQTLLAAERGAGYRVAVAVSPAAESWTGNPVLQQRLLKAADNTHIPVLIIHPAHDVSLEPGKVLGAEFQKGGKQFQLKIFSPSGTPALDEHCFGGSAGDAIWAPDALSFIAAALAKP